MVKPDFCFHSVPCNYHLLKMPISYFFVDHLPDQELLMMTKEQKKFLQKSKAKILYMSDVLSSCVSVSTVR